MEIHSDLLIRYAKWGIIYFWTIFSWVLGMVGALKIIKEVIIAKQGRLMGPDKDGNTSIQYGVLETKEMINGCVNLAIFAAWWYMILR